MTLENFPVKKKGLEVDLENTMYFAYKKFWAVL